jgi:hypothetical protein
MKFIDFILNKEMKTEKPAKTVKSPKSNLYDELMSIMDTLRFNNKEIDIMSGYYDDDVVSFSLSSFLNSDYIYIHDNTDVPNFGIILTINKDSSLDWTIKSEKCRNEVLTHLHNIIEDTKLLPSRESEFCKSITKVNNGESIKPKEPEMPQYKTITITVSDKLLGSCYGYTNYKIITTDKSIYYVGRLQLYNNLKVNETYNVILSRAEDYIIGIVGDVILDV